MDSSKVKMQDKRSINLTCMIKIDAESGEKPRRFKFDTGAQFTCMNIRDLDSNISEEAFKQKKYVTHEVDGVGIDESSVIKYYMVQVEAFTVAGIDLGSVPICITFDSRAQKRLLGLDIIMLLNTCIDFDKKEMQLSKTKQFLDFKKRKYRFEPCDRINMGIYSIDNGIWL